MLNALRQNLKEQSWPKWLLIIVAASMTLYLGAFFFGDGSTPPPGAEADWAAKVDGQAIPAARFRGIARRIDQNYRQLLGDSYSQVRGQFQIGTQALQLVLEQELILQDAARLGLGVSPKELDERIRSRPDLRDANGNYVGKQEAERRVSRFYPGGLDAFVRDVKHEIIVEKWTDLVSQAVTVDDAELERVHRERTEKTALDFVIVRSSDQQIAREITDEQAREWYAQNGERYERDAGRRIRLVTVARQPMLDSVTVSDEEILAEYQANQASYAHPEQRRARHILFRFAEGGTDEEKARLREQAARALERVQGGEDFAAVATELSDDTLSAQRGGDLGWFGRGQMVQAFEEAAFGAAPGSLAPITETQFGLHVIQVTDARDAGVQPLDEIRDEIRQKLRAERAEQRLEAEGLRVRDAIATPAQLAAVAEAEKLVVDSRFVSATEGLADLGPSAEFRDTVLDMAPGEISRPLRVRKGLAIVVVDELVPRSVAPFEDVASRVRTDILNARALAAAMQGGRRALEGARDFAAVAKALGAEPQDSGDLAPGQTIPGTGGTTAELRQRLFGDGAAVGARGVVEVPAGALVYEITRREPFDAEAFAAAKPTLRAELLQERRVAVRRSIVDQLSREREIVVNEPLVAQLDS